MLSIGRISLKGFNKSESLRDRLRKFHSQRKIKEKYKIDLRERKEDGSPTQVIFIVSRSSIGRFCLVGGEKPQNFKHLPTMVEEGAPCYIEPLLIPRHSRKKKSSTKGSHRVPPNIYSTSSF